MITLKRIIFLAVLLTLAVGIPAWQRWRQGELRTACKLNLKMIGAGLHAYHESNASFPAAYSGGPVSHSWRVALLPSLDQQALHSKYNFEQAWDQGGNRDLLPLRPAAYSCPEVIGNTRTSYQAVVGLQTAWPYDQSASMRDITDGTSNTIMVLDVHSPEVEWTSPKDLSYQDAMESLQSGQRHSPGPGGGAQVLLADGSVRFISSRIDPKFCKNLLTASSGASVVSGPLSKDAAARANKEFPVHSSASFASPISVESLPATDLSPFADVAIPHGRSIVYCPTMSLAWKQYVNVMPQVALTHTARRLIDNPFSAGDIDPESVRIVAGSLDAEEVRQMRNEFLGSEAGESKLRTASGGPAVWCGLRKQLAFIARFEAFKLPLTFHDGTAAHTVKSFGVTSHWDDWRNALEQMRVADYRSPDDFVIQIGNLNGEDLILAKLPQPSTLNGAIADVECRIRNSSLPPEARSVVTNEQIVIPMLEISLIVELTDDLNHPDQPVGSRVQSAAQVIQFRLDEQGALLISEVEVVGENGHYEYAVGTRTFIFDKPFLIMLRESPSKNPYFAAWIGNSDLMVEDR